MQFHVSEELLLNVPFTAEEVMAGVGRLKSRKAPGPSQYEQKLKHL